MEAVSPLGTSAPGAGRTSVLGTGRGSAARPTRTHAIDPAPTPRSSRGCARGFRKHNRAQEVEIDLNAGVSRLCRRFRGNTTTPRGASRPVAVSTGGFDQLLTSVDGLFPIGPRFAQPSGGRIQSRQQDPAARARTPPPSMGKGYTAGASCGTRGRAALISCTTVSSDGLSLFVTGTGDSLGQRGAVTSTADAARSIARRRPTQPARRRATSPIAFAAGVPMAAPGISRSASTPAHRAPTASACGKPFHYMVRSPPPLVSGSAA